MPRLRSDAYLIPTENGARIVTNHGGETFTGASIHRWISTLAPYLTGTTTVRALVDPLPSDKRAMVEQIIATLMDRGLACDGVPAGQQRVEFGYLDAFVPEAGQAFQRYSDARMLLLGSGDIVTELARLLDRSGAQRVTALVTAECPITAQLAVPVHTGDLPAVLAGGADLVVHVSDRSMPGRALAVDRACRDAGIPLVHGTYRSGELWIGSADFESGWRRLHRWLGSGGAACFLDRPDTPVRVPPDSVAVAAAMIGMAAFRTLTGVLTPVEASTMTCLDLASLRTTTHRFLPCRTDPVRPAEQSTVDTVARLRAGPALEPDALDTAATRMLDVRLGALGAVSERDFVQLPLNVAAVSVAGWSVPVVGAGLTVRQARWRAVLSGIAAYAVSTVDQARLAGGRVWAARLAGGGARLLDPDAVFAPPDQWPSGVAARYTWSGAVSEALLDGCARLAAAWAPAEPARLDPAGLGPDDEAAAYLRMLDIFGVRLTVLDVTGPLRVPTMAFCSGRRTVAYVSALRAADTLPDGLRAVVLDEQARRAGQPAYAPPPVSQLPAVRPDATPGVAPAPCTEPALLDALRGAGLDPVVVPLDHDPEVHRIMPYAARVVLADARP